MDHFRDNLATVYAMLAFVFLIAFRLDERPMAVTQTRGAPVCALSADGLEHCHCEGIAACFALGQSGRCLEQLVVEPGRQRGRCAAKPAETTELVIR